MAQAPDDEAKNEDVQTNNDENISKTVIVDLGSSVIKAGFSGDLEPCLKQASTIENENKNDVDAIVNRGLVFNFDSVEKLLKNTFTKLGIEPEKYSMLFAEYALYPIMCREKMTEILFESFKIESYYTAINSVLSLYGSGRITGAVVDVGHGVTHIVPVYDGHAIEKSVIRLDLAGLDVTNYLTKLLSDNDKYKDYELKGDKYKEAMRDIKEKYSYCSLNYKEELKQSEHNNNKNNNNGIVYNLPDGKELIISNERFSCCEILFNPAMINKESDGIDQLLYWSVNKCQDNEIERILYNNIVLSGGTTNTRQFGERLTIEMNRLLAQQAQNDNNNDNNNNNNNNNVNYNAFVSSIENNKGEYATWIGGSILSNMPQFKQFCMTKDEYDEHGKGLIHRKCFLPDFDGNNKDDDKDEKEERLKQFKQSVLDQIPKLK